MLQCLTEIYVAKKNTDTQTMALNLGSFLFTSGQIYRSSSTENTRPFPGNDTTCT
jgi:hypothetical protein